MRKALAYDGVQLQNRPLRITRTQSNYKDKQTQALKQQQQKSSRFQNPLALTPSSKKPKVCACNPLLCACPHPSHAALRFAVCGVCCRER